MTPGWEWVFSAVGAGAAVVGVGAAASGGVVWMATLHARVGHARRDAASVRGQLRAHEALCDERYDNIVRLHTETREWMARLDAKIDDVLRGR